MRRVARVPLRPVEMAALFGDEASQQRHGTRLVLQGHWAEIGEHRSAAAEPHLAVPWTGVRVIRLFSFYFRRVTLRQVALDAALVFAVIAMSISSQIAIVPSITPNSNFVSAMMMPFPRA